MRILLIVSALITALGSALAWTHGSAPIAGGFLLCNTAGVFCLDGSGGKLTAN